jgi:hypothetical protein
MTRSLKHALAALLIAFAGLAVASIGVKPAQAQGTAVSAIEVDVSQLRARGAGVFADIVQNALRDELGRRYTISGGAPRLVVQIEQLFLNGDIRPSGDSMGFGVVRPEDNLTGTARLIDRSGQVIDTYRFTASSPADSAGDRVREGIERDRTINLARVYAGWVARRF